MLTKLCLTRFLKISFENQIPLCKRTLSVTGGGGPVDLAFLKSNQNEIDTNLNPIFMFHGAFGSKQNLRSLANQIGAQSKRQVFVFDLRNHGESPHTVPELSNMKANASDIKLFMEKNQISKASMIGHSLGGRVISQFAFCWPELVEKLILVDINPLPMLPKIDFLTKGFFTHLENSVLNLPRDMPLHEARKNIRTKLLEDIKNPFIVDFFILNLYHDVNDENRIKWRFNVSFLKLLIKDPMISSVDCVKPFEGDSLVIYGENSPYFEREKVDDVKKLMPNIKIQSIPNTGHYLHVEQPHQFIKYCVDFL